MDAFSTMMGELEGPADEGMGGVISQLDDEAVPSESVALAVVEVPGKGKGVVATAAIPKDSLVEVSQALRIPATEYAEHIQHTVVGDYCIGLTTGVRGCAACQCMVCVQRHSCLTGILLAWRRTTCWLLVEGPSSITPRSQT